MHFDESNYLEFYPDVAAAVAEGRFTSGCEHFQLFGRAEGRSPNPPRSNVANRLFRSLPSTTIEKLNAATIVSLGTACRTAWLIKVLGLKKASYPFDCIFSQPAMVEEIIKNDFVDFLDKQHHLTISSTSSDHILYKKIFGITSIFNHHDLCNADSFQRYIRCIERFRELKTSSTRTIFIMVDSSIDPEFAHSLGNQLTQAFSSFTLFVKHNQSSGSMLLPQARLLNCDANHSLIEFVHLGGLAAVTFEREVDDLCLATLVLDEIVSHLD